MNVKELKELLSSLPDDMEVIIQKDSEGNGYSPLSSVDSNCVYVPTNKWSGDVYFSHWVADDSDMSEEEWEELKSRKKSLVLTPTN